MNLPLPHDPAEFIGTIPVSLSAIAASPTNPRERFPEAEMAELTESVRKHGVLQPILLRPWPADYKHAAPLPHYELVAGERRWRAAKAAGLTAIEAKVRELEDEEVLEIQIIENLQRQDLHPLEEAIGYERMMKEYHYTADSLAEKVHKSKAYIYGRLKLTALCHESRKAFFADKLSASTALLIARIPNDQLQEQATREITDPNWQGEGMSVRAAMAHLQKKYMLRLIEAPFPVGDALLVKKAGSCEHCPKRTGNQPPDLFKDVESADVCTDPGCFAEKRQAHLKNTAAAATAKGQKVITGKAAEKLMPYGDTCDLQGGLISLDRKCYADEKGRTYREIIGDHAIEIQLVENIRKGNLVEVVQEKQLAEALKAAGISSGRSVGSNSEKEAEKKAKAEREYRRHLHAAVRTALAKDFAESGAALEPEELVIVAQAFFDRTELEGRKAIVRLWTPDATKIGNEEAYAFTGEIRAMASADLCLLLLDCALIGQVMVSSWNYEKTPDKLLEIARNSAIDPAEIRKSIAAEARKKASPPTKAAQAGEPNRAKKTKADAPKPADFVSDGEVVCYPSANAEVITDQGADALYDQAVEVVVKARRVSISLVQRNLNIGYNRAARLIEAMEKAGLVSAMDGQGGRELLTPKPAVDEERLKVGDRVLVKCTPPRNIDGREGVIVAITGPLLTGGEITVRTAQGLLHGLFWNELEKLPDATQAAPAAEQNPGTAEQMNEKAEQAAPAKALNPAGAWPFPVRQEQASDRASPVERKPAKSKKVMNEKTVTP